MCDKTSGLCRSYWKDESFVYRHGPGNAVFWSYFRMPWPYYSSWYNILWGSSLSQISFAHLKVTAESIYLVFLCLAIKQDKHKSERGERQGWNEEELDHALSISFVRSSVRHFLKHMQVVFQEIWVVLLWKMCWNCIRLQYTVSTDAEPNVDGELLLMACWNDSVRILFFWHADCGRVIILLPWCVCLDISYKEYKLGRFPGPVFI